MNTEKKLTGYPSIDKPWLKYYDKKFLEMPIPKMKIYDYMKKCTANDGAKTAITFYGNKISYNELHKNIDAAARALYGMGVRNGDRILYLMPNLPETAYLFYGANKLGAVSDFADPRPSSTDIMASAQQIFDLFVSEKASHLIVLDQCYLFMIRPLEDKYIEKGLKNILVISPKDSIKGISKLTYISESIKFNGLKALKESLRKTNYISAELDKAKKDAEIKVLNYYEIVKQYSSSSYAETPYSPDNLALIVHTSGTSSLRPKPIPLTNDNLNFYLHQTFGSNMVMKNGDKALHILPYSAAFGIVNVVHAGFCHCNNLICIPEFSISALGKMILHHKPQTLIGAPSWFTALTKDAAMKKADLSCLTMITYGGDSMDTNDEKAVNDFLQQHSCKHILTKGHGMSETCGGATFAINEYNKIGSVGIPMSHTVYGLINPETKELMRFNEGDEFIEGELIISSGAVTSGVLDGNVIVPRAVYNNEEYIFTRDIARMDRNGIITFLSRNDRSFTRYDGFKVKPYEIEKLIKTNEKIKYCIISPYWIDEFYGNIIVADIVAENSNLSREEQREIAEDIINNQFVKNSQISTRQIPYRFRFRTDIPITKNSKINYNQILSEKLDGTEVVVTVEETNLAVGKITIN